MAVKGYFCNMKVDDALIENLAHLARLEFSEEEKAGLRKDLQSMIAFVEKLNEVNTDGIKPLLHMSSAVNVFREDKIKGSATREEALQNAPLTDGVFFKVPKVIPPALKGADKKD
jgi:aspartyl-tRNA(Asn)/glutamyl-tRNA(Gln) amidotransferase subunit C